MSVKAAKNCVENLMAKGINAASIVVLTPTVVLDTTYMQSSQVDYVSKDDTPNPSSENWF